MRKILANFTITLACLSLTACADDLLNKASQPLNYYPIQAPNPYYQNPNPYVVDNNSSPEQYSWNNKTYGYNDPYDVEPAKNSDPYGDDDYKNSNPYYTVKPTSVRLPAQASYFNNQIGNIVHFDVDSINISARSASILHQQAQWLAQHHHKILIEGYTDDRGTRVYNIALGKHRAAAVKNFLINEGVPAQSIKTVSYGMERPVAVCQSEHCWAQNRRARTVLY